MTDVAKPQEEAILCVLRVRARDAAGGAMQIKDWDARRERQSMG